MLIPFGTPPHAPRFLAGLIATLLLCVFAPEARAYTEVQSTPLGEARPPRPGKGVKLFFGSEPVPFAYRKIALLHAAGAEGTGQTEVLDSLKRRAWALGADALIEVVRTTERREDGAFFLKKRENPREFSVVAFTGIAIAATDPLFEPESDTSFHAPEPPGPRKPQSALEIFGEGLLVFAGVIALGGILILAAMAEQQGAQ